MPRDLFEEFPQQTQTPRDLFAEPTPQERVVEQQIATPGAQIPTQPTPSMLEMWEGYKAGQMPEEKRPLFEELMRRKIGTMGIAGEPQINETSGIKDIISGVGETAIATGNLALEAAKNLPESTINLMNEIGKAFLSPIDTASEIGDIALGAVQELIPGEQRAEIKFEAVADMFKDRYGSLSSLNTAIAEDPAGVALDVSAVLTGGGSLAGKLPGVVGRMGSAAAEIGAAADPVAAIAKTGKAITDVAGKLATESLGAATGAGPEAIRQASMGLGLTSDKSGFVKSLRGNVSGESILESAKSALGSIKERRGLEYRKKLGELARDKRNIDTRSIKSKMMDLMDRYGVKVDKEGNLDYSRSSIGRNAQSDVTEVIETVSEWGTKPGDNTAIGLDLLKRKLDDFYSESKNSRAMVSELRNDVKNKIVKNVPEYAEMTKGYESLTKTTNEMERALSLNNRAMMDTAIKKLTSTMRENFDFRRQLLDEIESLSGKSLSQEIAGLTMSQVIPKGLVGKLAAGGAAASSVVSPWLVPMAALTSPRLMGEFLNAMGFAKNVSSKVVKNLKKTGAFKQQVRQPAIIAGRSSEEEQTQ